MADRMPIDDLKRLQRERGLTDVHIAHLDERGFTLAHTDHERATMPDLEECSIHRWLVGHDPEDPPAEPGLYVIHTHQPDGYSESYRSEPWELEPLG